MGTIAIVILLSCFNALLKSEHIWDGPCGQPGPTRKQVNTILSSARSDVLDKDIGVAIATRMTPVSNDTQDLLETNPWQIFVFSVSDELVRGTATLIRVKPGQNATDMAITSPHVCKSFQEKHKDDLAVRFINNAFPDQRIIGCWEHPSMAINGFNLRLALLKFSQPVPLDGSSRITAVCLPDQDETITWIPGTIGTMVGLRFYRKDISGFEFAELPAHLASIDMRIMDQNQCRRYWGTSLSAKNRTFCTESLTFREGVKFGKTRSDLAFLIKKDRRTVMLGLAANLLPYRVESFKWMPSAVLRLAPYLYSSWPWLERTIKQESSLWVSPEAAQLMPESSQSAPALVNPGGSSQTNPDAGPSRAAEE